MNVGLRVLGVITSFAMLIVLLQGALVTTTGSGEGCGSTWPLCFGEILPANPALATLIEYSHRLWSGLTGLLVLILAIWSWRKLSHLRETKFLALMAILFIVFQGFMGAGAVIWNNSGLILALHFGISTISFATVSLLTALAFENNNVSPHPLVSKKYINYLITTIIYSYIVIYTGAYIKHSGYDMTIQWIHRSAAVLLILIIAGLMVWTLKRYHSYSSLLGISIAMFILILIQAGAGLAIIYGAPYLTFALLHALTISVVFTMMIYKMMIITRRSPIS
ncbi:COX15/CtaA family protein [Salibacterium qingdaonense]|uniref:Cytochrome c oxidase assembly protein subunit 15 n=1 Tax=Salibacterium qingdaonense TaxID=266892 RepID=A0A1I4IN51_9BACI|nr:heme A synthase [Salibacterium qingdaonense]SFL55186.1 cytochrome c oxidase assembly protein subunit 15 [Salibacterium qingdaonense]